MADVSALIEQGKAAIKAGRKADAKAILSQAVEQDEQSEDAWLWLSACVDTVADQKICLENVLEINPNNEKAKKGLAAISQKVQSKPSAPTPSAPVAPPPPAKPASPAFSGDDPFGGFDSNPFAGTGFDSNPYGTTLDPALDSQWDSFGADSASSVPTSVDWGRESGAAAYGSGKDVNQPSPDEYDNWVSNLSLGGSSASTETDYSPASGPFGSESFEFDNYNGAPAQPPAPSGTSTPASVSPFDDFDFSSFQGSSNAFTFDEPADNGPFNLESSNDDAATSTDLFSGGYESPAPAVQSPPQEDDDPFGGNADIDLNGSIFADIESPAPRSTYSTPAAEPTTNNPFGNSRASALGRAIPERDDSAAGGFAFIDSNTAPSQEAYFSAIPPEIQANGSVGKPGGRLIMTVALLAALNVLSIAFLLFNLTRH